MHLLGPGWQPALVMQASWPQPSVPTWHMQELAGEHATWMLERNLAWQGM